jgi:membrane-associated protease RseP (regulator of RpoE activity)
VEITVLRAGKKQTLESKIAQRDRKSDELMALPRRAEAPNLRFFGEDGGVFNFGPLARRFEVETARPRLGVSVLELSEQLAEKYGVKGKEGVLVSSVNAGSPADKAGLKAGDVILEANGTSIADADSLTRALRRIPDGDTVELQIYRDGKPMVLKAQLEGPSKKSGAGERVIL